MTDKYILGIETSCDDTSLAILKGSPDSLHTRPTMLAQLSFSQEMLLAKWGGVVPEIAARNHLDKLIPLCREVFDKAQIKPEQIDLYAVTTHPGLLGPLLTGLNMAKTFALYFQKPVRCVNHLYAHLEAIHLTEEVSYPYLGLLVSGGHTLFVVVESPVNFQILGGTVDDAAGEAFDKGGKLLGLGYPAGRIIDDLAKKGDEKKYEFNVGMLKADECHLSFSGIKTGLRFFIEQNKEFKIEDVCASYQSSIVNALVKKLKVAQKLAGKNLPIVVGGGVACNSKLREEIQKHFEKAYFVKPVYCTDNGGMIANYALRTFQESIPFPECLSLDARGQFISKQDKLEMQRNR